MRSWWRSYGVIAVAAAVIIAVVAVVVPQLGGMGPQTASSTAGADNAQQQDAGAAAGERAGADAADSAAVPEAAGGHAEAGTGSAPQDADNDELAPPQDSEGQSQGTSDGSASADSGDTASGGSRDDGAAPACASLPVLTQPEVAAAERALAAAVGPVTAAKADVCAADPIRGAVLRLAAENGSGTDDAGADSAGPGTLTVVAARTDDTCASGVCVRSGVGSGPVTAADGRPIGFSHVQVVRGDVMVVVVPDRTAAALLSGDQLERVARAVLDAAH